MKGRFPVVGFLKDPTGSPLSISGGEGKDLVYMGKVGTGWNRTTSSQIRERLETAVSPKTKPTKPIAQSYLDRTKNRNRIPGYQVGRAFAAKLVQGAEVGNTR